MPRRRDEPSLSADPGSRRRSRLIGRRRRESRNRRVLWQLRRLRFGNILNHRVIACRLGSSTTSDCRTRAWHTPQAGLRFGFAIRGTERDSRSGLQLGRGSSTQTVWRVSCAHNARIQIPDGPRSDGRAEDDWRNVYTGELEVHPPGAPTTRSDTEQRGYLGKNHTPRIF